MTIDGDDVVIGLASQSWKSGARQACAALTAPAAHAARSDRRLRGVENGGWQVQVV